MRLNGVASMPTATVNMRHALSSITAPRASAIPAIWRAWGAPGATSAARRMVPAGRGSRRRLPRPGDPVGRRGDRRDCRRCRGSRRGCPSARSRAKGRCGGLIRITRIMAALPAARAEVMVHNRPPCAGHLEEDQLAAEACAGQRAQQQCLWRRRRSAVRRRVGDEPDGARPAASPATAGTPGRPSTKNE